LEIAREGRKGPVMLVIDYAETRTGLSDLLRAVAADDGIVRVLLLARAAGEWWDRLAADEPAVRDLVTQAGHEQPLAVAVSEDQSDEDLMRAATQAFAKALGIAVPPHGAVQAPAGAVRILDLHAAALVAVLRSDGQGSVPLSVTDVVDELLGHEERFWQGTAQNLGLLAGPDGMTVTTLRQIVTAAALLGARSQAQAVQLLRRVPGAAATVKVASWLRDLYPPDPAAVSDADAEWLGRLQPDRLAERLAVSQLTKSPLLDWADRRIQRPDHAEPPAQLSDCGQARVRRQRRIRRADPHLLTQPAATTYPAHQIGVLSAGLTITWQRSSSQDRAAPIAIYSPESPAYSRNRVRERVRGRCQVWATVAAPPQCHRGNDVDHFAGARFIAVGPQIGGSARNGVAGSQKAAHNRGHRPSYGLGGLMGLWPRIGLTGLAMVGAWALTWLALVIIGDQSDANWVIGIVVGAVGLLVGFWAVSGRDGSGVGEPPAAQRAGGASSGTQTVSAGQEGGAALDSFGTPVAYLSLLGKHGPKTLARIRLGEQMIGRHPASCEIQVPDRRKFRRAVGRVHARLVSELVSDRPVTWVEGLHHNGTYVEDELVSMPGRRQLKDGDEISLGGKRGARGVCVFRFTLRPQQVKVSSTGSSTEGETTTILMVAADPGKAGWQRLDHELQAIDRAVRGSQMTIEAVPVTSLSGLDAALPGQERSIIHFTGQTGGGAGVPLTAEDCGAAQVTAEELGRFFQANAPHVRCVVLSSCYTRQQGLAIAQHVQCVVGTPSAMPGDAAVAFSRAFYQALANGQLASAAFKAGQRAAGAQSTRGDPALPVLHVQPSAERTCFAP
jgi:pSer/pThr/pTyr-binding forkhead associated (FHA) protein